MREVAGDGDSLRWVDAVAALEVVPGRAERELARHRVDGVEVQERCDGEGVVEATDDRPRIVGAGGNEQVRRPYACGRPITTTSCVSCCLAAELPRGLERREIPAQRAAIDKRARRGSDSFAVEGRASEAARTTRVIDDRDLLVGNALSDLVREEAPSLEHVVRGEERSDRAQKLHSHKRIEKERQIMRHE